MQCVYVFEYESEKKERNVSVIKKIIFELNEMIVRVFVCVRREREMIKNIISCRPLEEVMEEDPGGNQSQPSRSVYVHIVTSKPIRSVYVYPSPSRSFFVCIVTSKSVSLCIVTSQPSRSVYV